MTNGEKYKDKIIRIIKAEDEDSVDGTLCDTLIKPYILPYYKVDCGFVDCRECKMLQMLWLNEEYKESEICYFDGYICLQCPECGKLFGLRNEYHTGETIECPRCKVKSYVKRYER